MFLNKYIHIYFYFNDSISLSSESSQETLIQDLKQFPFLQDLLCLLFRIFTFQHFSPLYDGLEWPHLWGYHIAVKSYAYNGSQQFCVYIDTHTHQYETHLTLFRNILSWYYQLYSRKADLLIESRARSKCFSNTPQELENKSNRRT